jgi:hypothetical protein
MIASHWLALVILQLSLIVLVYTNRETQVEGAYTNLSERAVDEQSHSSSFSAHYHKS